MVAEKRSGGRLQDQRNQQRTDFVVDTGKDAVSARQLSLEMRQTI
jgi:hypothetical protein